MSCCLPQVITTDVVRSFRGTMSAEARQIVLDEVLSTQEPVLIRHVATLKGLLRDGS